MKSLIVFFLVAFTSNCFALRYDYNAQAVFRSYPQGAAVDATGGAAWEIWKARGIFYGYVRPSISFQTSGVTNQLTTQIDIFPISFFGFFIGKSWNKRDYEKFATFDCDAINCSGQVRRTFVGHKMALAFHNFFLLSTWKISRVEMTDRAGVFADVTASLLARSHYDQLLSGQVALGYKWNETHSFGALYIHNNMKYLDNTSKMWMGFHRYSWKNYSFMSSLGIMHSRLDQKVGSALFIFKWTPEKGLPLL